MRPHSMPPLHSTEPRRHKTQHRAAARGDRHPTLDPTPWVGFEVGGVLVIGPVVLLNRCKVVLDCGGWIPNTSAELHNVRHTGEGGEPVRTRSSTNRIWLSGVARCLPIDFVRSSS